MKIYVVTMRCGTELEHPMVFKSKQEADKKAKEYVLDFAREVYSDDGGNINARKSTIEKWADENGYSFDDYYFWDGGSDAVEVRVDEMEV